MEAPENSINSNFTNHLSDHSVAKDAIGFYVLCGGKSRRMGKNKGLIQLKKGQLIEYGLNLLSRFGTTFLLTSDPAYKKFPYKQIPDIYTNIGPLAGIHAAVYQGNYDYYLIIPCDTPNLNENVIQQLIDNRLPNGITYAKTNSKDHPLIGIYASEIFPALKAYIRKDGRKVMEFISKCPNLPLLFEDENLFLNTNYPEDLKFVANE